MDLGFNGKTALVTGGSKGLGAGICEVFAEEGANVIVNYRSDPEGSKAFAEKLRDEYGIDCEAFQADIGKEDQVAALFDYADERFGGVDILVNNAGMTGPNTNGVINEMSLEKWQANLDGNITGMFLMCREFANRRIRDSKGGRVVNILSKAALSTTTKGHLALSANKAGEMGLTKQMAVDLTDKGIIVNGICPGSVWTKPEPIDYESDRVKRQLERMPLHRYGEPKEIGKMVAFLSSDQCSLAVGSVVDATGGLFLGF